jgi:hypothetical protein
VLLLGGATSKPIQETILPSISATLERTWKTSIGRDPVVVVVVVQLLGERRKIQIRGFCHHPMTLDHPRPGEEGEMVI